VKITASVVKKLRDKTGAGMMDCKRALKEAEGDEERAIEILRKKGAASAKKRSGRQTAEGVVHAYIHPGGRVGVLIEVNCETDFVARNDDFKVFVNNIAMQVAAAQPLSVDREGIPSDIVEIEKRIYTEQMQESGKPQNIIEKIVEGKLAKFYKENCLLEQPYVKDNDLSINDYLVQARAKIGENVVIKRFVRYQLGE